MINLRKKAIFQITITFVLILGAYNTASPQAKIKTSSSKFLILVETTTDGLKLSGQEGCAWKQLTFTLNEGRPQAIDQYGMTALNREKPTADNKLSNFLFIIKKTKEGISLEGIEGTAWVNLSFSCPKGRCYQYIDFSGMSVKDGHGLRSL